MVAVSEEDTFKTLIQWVSKTMEGRSEVRAEVGLYATVIDVGHNLGIAMSTDGVGTKILVAEMMERYDTVGIDCVAMNVNDLICVGARPIAMLDYIAVEDATGPLLGDIGRGLYEGAKLADISISVGKSISPLSVSLVFYILSYIFSSGWKNISSLSVSFTIHKVASIFLAIGEYINTCSINTISFYTFPDGLFMENEKK